jgi:hypothetical protein
MVARSRKAGDRPLYFICRSGGRSQHACEQFMAAGYTDVVNVAGGTQAWLEANLPVVWNDPAITVPRGGAAGVTTGCGRPGCGCHTKNA